MKLSETVISAIVLCLSLSIFCSAMGPFSRLTREYEAKKQAFVRNSFIAESFTALCSQEESTMDDFEQWKKLCCAMYHLDSIEIKKNQVVQELKCIWSKDGISKSLVCRRAL